jgi:GT2 family glycosyltransferase
MGVTERLRPVDPAIAVSVIIVNWNVRDLLLAAIGSVFESAGTVGVECIVVDNASSDGSADAVNARFPAVTVIRNTDNVGYAHANNQGIREARGRYLLFLNPDTRVIGDALPAMVRVMDGTPAIGALGAKLLTKDLRWSRDNGYRSPTLRTIVNEYSQLARLLPFPRVFPGILRSRDFHGLEDCDWISGAAFMVRREVAETEQWNEQIFFFAEDVEYSERIHRRGWRVAALGSAGIIHYSGQSMIKQEETFLANRVSATARLLSEREHPVSVRLAVAVIQASLFVRSRLHWLRYRLSGDVTALDKSRRLRQYLQLERSKV